ncbi:MAG TPA: GerW family sporulation protein [Pseudobacteroides sp.]|uniref:GerW family sporulation protein n=1 Tax=Pseudobacteroides sp. TaxID=1968840 RepID=UPI002F947200
MAEHPIQGLMNTAMSNIKEMVDVNTIVGDAVQAPDGTVIIPISKVTFGFAAGGGEYNNCCEVDSNKDDDDDSEGKKASKFPFAGGSGAGVSIVPIGFMVVGNDQVKLLPVDTNSSLDKVLDMIPEIVNKTTDAIKKKMDDRKNAKNNTKNDENNNSNNNSQRTVTIITDTEEK